MSFPKVSFGLQVYDDATKYTQLALEAGIRNFFSSVLAGNQKGFGVAVKAAKTIHGLNFSYVAVQTQLLALVIKTLLKHKLL